MKDMKEGKDMKIIYQQDEYTLSPDKITEYTHPVYGEVTVFHDVVIASEIVQQYSDGYAYKPREELQQYTWTADGRWVTLRQHPQEGVISTRDQVSGRTVNPRYVKNLKDHETGRPNRAGVLADVEIFNERTTPQALKDMRDGKKPDVSIGFFYTHDATKGVVNDGPFKGREYDYVQRNMFHDHLAACIDNGRCPMPLCGIGADELGRRLTGDPFAGFEGFDGFVAKILEENSDLSRGDAEKICGELKSEHEDTCSEDTLLNAKVRELITVLMDELEEVKGMRDAEREHEWITSIDWGVEPFTSIYGRLAEDTRLQIKELGLCPTCEDEEETGSEDESMDDSEESTCEEGYEMNEEGECVPIEETEDESEGKEKSDEPSEESEPDEDVKDEASGKRVDVDALLERANRVLG